MRVRIANWILSCVVAPADRETVLGDLVEEYAIRARESRTQATSWYWSQILRSMPSLLWMPIRRGGLIVTLVVALGACMVQAALEISTALLLRRALAPDSTAMAMAMVLGMVLVSLFAVSYGATRVRPGAGTLLTLIALVAGVAQTMATGSIALHLTHVAAALAAPSATFAGAVCSTSHRVQL